MRVVNDSIDELDDNLFLKYYPGGGRSSYHPKMMTKILVYAYTQKIYTSRQIAKAVREQLPFMWIAARQKPDFRTINRFRSERMKYVIDEVFASVLELLIKEGYVKFENYFLDGTKVEANANRYSFVWKKSTDRYEANLQAKIKELLQEIEEENERENEIYGDKDLDELGEDSQITSEDLEKTVEKLESRLKEEPKNKKVKKAVKTIKKDYLPRTRKYEKYQSTFNGRNSFSKTDKDATFMRMKEDHMKNGQLKPGYNIQLGTENQFILGYSIHQKPTDTTCLIPHLEKLEEQLGNVPQNIIADAGYGSEENYRYLEEKDRNAYVKYNTYFQEQKRSWRKKIFRRENMHYDAKNDKFICPNGKELHFQYEKSYKTEAGYITKRRLYRCFDCQECELKEKCTKSKKGRTVWVNWELESYKQKARENLGTDHGRELSSQRKIDVESVNGHFKANRMFRRFMLRGLDKVNIELGLISLAHNMIKKAAIGF
ncbi:transposase IS4 family protein [Natranaerobius thermophilus JW/NM-WN-LF]|uniref:Transposase IS4 family protein n=1 Tax=Natranaerobius thermophilus (strain ATCC BAA-1301 / DSM 18059 / JW/NM-WN-LF) TaxID=457570 RepID=B2A1J7_NATTJ|nr:transposase IS4 family protein [Natranaerobius thermophilus JW/NM-WN-LF]